MSVGQGQISSNFPKRGLFYHFSEGLSNGNAILFHLAATAGVLFVGRWGIIAWFYITLIYAANFVLKESLRSYLPAFLLYIVPLELFGRIMKASPIIPYEVGKYMVFSILIFLLSTLKIKKGSWGLFLIIMCIPGAFLVSDERPYKDLVFNLLGLINMGLGAIVFSNFAISKEQLRRSINIALWPILVLLLYLIIKTPDLTQVDFELGANSETTAGFGSNQVSTILGFGLILFGFQYLFDWKFAKKQIINVVILGLILFWGLISFSRGGIVGAVLSLGMVNLLSIKRKSFTNPKSLKLSFLVPAFLVVSIAFYIGNEITDGTLYHRYTGETSGTLAGSAEKDLNNMTSGRANIVIRDYNIWMDNFILGVGVGQSDNVGEEFYGDGHIAHVEASRLLAEHGIFGLFCIIILFLLPAQKILREKIPIKRSWMILLVTISLFTTFHSATRTVITPILFGLAFLNIYETEEDRLNNLLKKGKRV